MNPNSVERIASYLADGFWSGRGGYSAPVLSRDVTVNITGLNAGNQALVKLALQAWENLGFTFTLSTSARADILFSDRIRGAATSWEDRGGLPLVHVGPDFTAAYGSHFGSYTYQSWLHEIGHALGLGHSGPYNGTGSFATDARFADDSWQMTVMSYFPQDENPNTNASFAYVLTPMAADIRAVEMLYGVPATPIGAGNQVYLWATNATGIMGVIGRELQSGRLSAPVTMTIVDHDGVDTLNFGGSRQSVTLDLAPGAVSSALGLRDNIVIEANTVIENANGSMVNDV
ncbi:MAG: M10 family metallopeptidase, partial [Paracoccus sp. (in: a-proteobacteria)]|nr:M10 family metallopeptidase [Paracoccus sp. (in: a-proteobacteria)]